MAFHRITEAYLIHEDGAALTQIALRKGLVERSYALNDDRSPCVEFPEGSREKNELVVAMVDAYKIERSALLEEVLQLERRVNDINDQIYYMKAVNRDDLEELYKLNHLYHRASPEDRESAYFKATEFKETQLNEYFDCMGELLEARFKAEHEIIMVQNSLEEIDESWGIPRK